MRTAKGTLEELDRLLDELKERPHDTVLLVEGRKDVSALWVLGVEGEVWQVQTGQSIFQLAERLAQEKKRAIILTDWDRKGGQICRLLRKALDANGVPYDDSQRTRLVRISKKEIKDVESLPAFMSRLVSEAEKER
jgi:5S rRNA maturation endonuclease (ribonuclease M5)